MIAYKIIGENVDIFDGPFSRGVRIRPLAPALPEPEMPYMFRVLDDDGDVYFWGVSSDCDSEEAFAPLDYEGSRYGATSIEYLNEHGEWEEL